MAIFKVKQKEYKVLIEALNENSIDFVENIDGSISIEDDDVSFTSELMTEENITYSVEY